jgi:hypothetical protein
VTSFQDEVVNSAIRKRAAHCQAGRTSADNDTRSSHHVTMLSTPGLD